MSHKRKPPIGLEAFFKAVLLGVAVGFVLGFLGTMFGVVQVPPGTLDPLPDYLSGGLISAFIGGCITGSLLYKWEKFRFFIG